jgi:hypothetical protein
MDIPPGPLGYASEDDDDLYFPSSQMSDAEAILGAQDFDDVFTLEVFL